ncbi:MAG: DUF4258 domain-containing protein [Deltaproteobacteria bacterium]|nr:DUF4258 domain-containing protein [Deltaproteobacteria bacterium]
MFVRLYVDPETDAPHLWRHGVEEQEVLDVPGRPIEDRPGRDGSRVAPGRTRGGRYLRVIYVPDPQPESVFVITAYELGPKAKHALRRRRRKKS